MKLLQFIKRIFKKPEKHRHKWVLYDQVSLGLLTVHNYYYCKKCQEVRDDYENPQGKFRIRPDFYKKQAKELTNGRRRKITNIP